MNDFTQYIICDKIMTISKPAQGKWLVSQNNSQKNVVCSLTTIFELSHIAEIN